MASAASDSNVGSLKRVGSRFRLVKQTPSSELDPADAEDESAAVMGSSEEDEIPIATFEVLNGVEMQYEGEEFDSDFHVTTSS